MAEEDAEEFLSEWFTVLNIGLGDFEFSRYFPSEGLWLFPRFRKSRESVPISLGMLELAAKMHKPINPNNKRFGRKFITTH